MSAYSAKANPLERIYIQKKDKPQIKQKKMKGEKIQKPWTKTSKKSKKPLQMTMIITLLITLAHTTTTDHLPMLKIAKDSKTPKIAENPLEYTNSETIKLYITNVNYKNVSNVLIKPITGNALLTATLTKNSSAALLSVKIIYSHILDFASNLYIIETIQAFDVTNPQPFLRTKTSYGPSNSQISFFVFEELRKTNLQLHLIMQTKTALHPKFSLKNLTQGFTLFDDSFNARGVYFCTSSSSKWLDVTNYQGINFVVFNIPFLVLGLILLFFISYKKAMRRRKTIPMATLFSMTSTYLSVGFVSYNRLLVTQARDSGYWVIALWVLMCFYLFFISIFWYDRTEVDEDQTLIFAESVAGSEPSEEDDYLSVHHSRPGMPGIGPESKTGSPGCWERTCEFLGVLLVSLVFGYGMIFTLRSKQLFTVYLSQIMLIVDMMILDVENAVGLATAMLTYIQACLLIYMFYYDQNSALIPVDFELDSRVGLGCYVVLSVVILLGLFCWRPNLSKNKDLRKLRETTFVGGDGYDIRDSQIFEAGKGGDVDVSSLLTDGNADETRGDVTTDFNDFIFQSYGHERIEDGEGHEDGGGS